MVFLDSALSLLAPHDCLRCGAEGKILCDWCRIETALPIPSRCYRCHEQTTDFTTCKSCRSRSKVARVWVATEYEGANKRLVQKLKFERAQSAATIVADLMAECLPFLPADTIITHIPTATSRRRQRGYDQSELLARRIAKIRGLRFSTLLARHGQSRQTGASRTVRQEQLAASFRAQQLASIKGAKIILVDDIVTTGATLEAAARVLKVCGAKQVSGAVFAQKLR